MDIENFEDFTNLSPALRAVLFQKHLCAWDKQMHKLYFYVFAN